MNAQSLKHIPVNGFKRAFTCLAGFSFILLLILNARISVYAQSSPGDFGSISLGTSTTETVTITILSAGTLGDLSVLTQGAAGLDFTDAGGDSCTIGDEYALNDTCTVKVTFAPRFTGPRYGAVVLIDPSNNNNVMATTYVHGAGLGPRLKLNGGFNNEVQRQSERWVDGMG